MNLPLGRVTRVACNGESGTVIEMRDGDRFEVIECHADGRVEYRRFEAGRLMEREADLAKDWSNE